MSEVSNPYAPPESNLSESGDEKTSEQARFIYTPLQVRLASFWGGPFAAIYTLYQNFKQLDNSRGMQLTLVFGIAFSILLFAAMPFFPEQFPKMLLPLAYSLAAGGIASSKQLSKEQINESNHYQRRSAWNVTAVTVLSFIAFCLIVIPFLFLLNHFGLLQA